jgi:PD-(D/E)XK nuclease superfamily
MKITNTMDISLPLAVWALYDDYDYIDEPNYISATSLMKPLRQIVLPNRIPPEELTADVSEFIARALGSTIHTGIEHAWTDDRHRKPLRKLGYTDEVIDRIVVNPTSEQLRNRNDIIPVFFEQRSFRVIEVNGTSYTIGGKFDMISDGIVNDFKSTSVWSWVKGTKDADYALQGSIYRWLNQDKITEDYIRVNFIFTDWQKAMVNTTEGYPRKRLEHKDIPLLTVQETERWIRDKLALVQQYLKTPEAQLPECTDEELWRSDPVYKFYADPTKANTPGARATKNFDNLSDARKFQAEKGGKGIIITKMGEAKACSYCAGALACTQKDRM